MLSHSGRRLAIMRAMTLATSHLHAYELCGMKMMLPEQSTGDITERWG